MISSNPAENVSPLGMHGVRKHSQAGPNKGTTAAMIASKMTAVIITGKMTAAMIAREMTAREMTAAMIARATPGERRPKAEIRIR